MPEMIPYESADAVVLALPNGKAADYVKAIDAKNPQAVDRRSVRRFPFRRTWYYGLPELTRRDYDGQRRISNPGCYATAMQLAIAPLLQDLAAPPACFGVSGYSGAGTTPSDRNDPEKLRDNLMPYSLTGHVHEREVTRHLGIPVEFVPHVAPHFRGITMTVNLWLRSRARRERRQAQVPRFLSRRAVDPRGRRGAVGQQHRRQASASRSAASASRRAASASSSLRRSTTCSRAPRRRRCRTSTSRSVFYEFAGIPP